MDKIGFCAKGAVAIAALLISPVILIFTVPLAVGVTDDIVHVAGVLPSLVTLCCALALFVSLSTRLRAH